MIDKDLQPIYKAMIKTTYVPVIRRTIVILLIHDLDRMQALANVDDFTFIEIIRTASAKKALYMCLDSIAKKRMDIIEKILLQYAINTSGAMNDFYHHWMDYFFLVEIDYVKRLVHLNRFEKLDEIARTQPE